MTDRRTLVRLATLVGGSASVYSVALATVVSLQSQADATTIAGRQPVVDAIGSVGATNDRLESLLGGAADSYGRVAADYDSLASAMTSLDDSVDALGVAVEDVSGRAAALPGNIALPRLTHSAPIQVTKRVVVHATTGASG
jgi:hypothetical protein